MDTFLYTTKSSSDNYMSNNDSIKYNFCEKDTTYKKSKS